jgi:RNA polymerase I specific initiation factor
MSTHCRSTRAQSLLTSKLPTMMTPFLFASPDGRAGSSSSASARRVHLRRLCDILHLSIQRGDLLLAQRSFAILSRCEDIEWAAIWKYGLIVLAAADQPDRPPGKNNDDDDTQQQQQLQLQLGTPKHIEYLRILMLRHPEEVRSHLLLFFLPFGWVGGNLVPLTFPLSSSYYPQFPGAQPQGPPNPNKKSLPPWESPQIDVSPTHHLSIWHFWQRESLVRELVLSLTMAGRERDALDELELCGSLIFFYVFFYKNKKKINQL